MTTARDIMHTGATCVGEHETLTAAAQHMRGDLGVGALPICGDDDRLHGMITDRDIVIKAIAAGLDLDTSTAGELAQGSTYHVDAEASIEGMLTVMEELPVRRLPVIEEHRLVGMVSEADIARHLPEHAIAQFVKAICAPRPSPATDPAVSKRQSLPPTPTDHRFIAKGVSGRIIGGST
jgi:CBS domain-containing protein